MWLIAIRLLPDLIQILMLSGEKKMVFLSGEENDVSGGKENGVLERERD